MQSVPSRVFRSLHRSVSPAVSSALGNATQSRCSRFGQQQQQQQRALSQVTKPTMAGAAAAAAVKSDEQMFCFQCEQTKNRTGCTEIGVCGKTAEVAKLQDLSVYCCRANAFYLDALMEAGVAVDDVYIDRIIHVLFATVTNVNFDPDRFVEYLNELMVDYNALKKMYNEHIGADERRFEVHEQVGHSFSGWSVEQLEELGGKVGVRSMQHVYGPSLAGVREMAIYGIKGSATYYLHAKELGMKDAQCEREFVKHLAWMVKTEHNIGEEALGQALGVALEVGGLNLRVMDKLDAGHRLQFGVPTPGVAQMTPRPGPCILISGHDLVDLKCVLDATKDLGINVYTHGEMLPAHGYPELRKYENLAGNYGGAWQLQQFEFPAFPGPILMTTNCLIEPRMSYLDRIYTLNGVGWPGAKVINSKNADELKPVIEQALAMKGFTQKECDRLQRPSVNVGFGRETILGAAGTILEEINKGTLKHVFLVGGCDGSENKRSWFTNMVDATPDESLILTLGCAKYRFNTHKDYGTLAETGIPRLLDMGQCNDAYGAVKVAMALAEALDTDINSLPLSLAISWFEQKAVAVLLTLLHLGVRNIRLGPVMPGFLTDEVYQILHAKFNVLPLDMKRKRDPAADVKLMMENQAAQLAASGGAKKKLKEKTPLS